MPQLDISVDLNKQIVESDLVELFLLENPNKQAVSPNDYFGFTNYHTTVYLRDKDSPYTHRTYTPFPISFSGYEQKSEGAYARPTIQIANILTTFSDALGNFTYEDMLGLKVIRRKTLAKYLDTGPSITSPAAAPIEYPRQVYVVGRVENENPVSVTFELTTPFDLEGIEIPGRKVYPYTCSWAYQGAAIDTTGTGYMGACTWKVASNNNGFSAYYDANNNLLLTGVTEASIPTSSSSQSHGIYKVAKSGLRRKETNGTVTTDNSKFDFYQVKTAGSTIFRKVRIYNAWNSGTTYYAYIESEYGNLVSYNNKIWLCIRSNSNQVPDSRSDYWRRVDVCGKKLESCAIRYKSVGVSGITGISGTIPSTDQDTTRELPYGGFPSSRRYNF